MPGGSVVPALVELLVQDPDHFVTILELSCQSTTRREEEGVNCCRRAPPIPSMHAQSNHTSSHESSQTSSDGSGKSNGHTASHVLRSEIHGPDRVVLASCLLRVVCFMCFVSICSDRLLASTNEARFFSIGYQRHHRGKCSAAPGSSRNLRT